MCLFYFFLSRLQLRVPVLFCYLLLKMCESGASGKRALADAMAEADARVRAAGRPFVSLGVYFLLCFAPRLPSFHVRCEAEFPQFC